MNNTLHSVALPRHALARHLVGISIALLGFITACNVSNGWFMPIISYTLMLGAIVGTAQYHLPKDKRAGVIAIIIINLVGSSLLLGALWFSGRMTQMF